MSLDFTICWLTSRAIFRGSRDYFGVALFEYECHSPVLFTRGYIDFSDFVEDWETQGMTEEGICARFCRPLQPGEPITHFHSQVDWWDGGLADTNPHHWEPRVSCFSLSDLPSVPSYPHVPDGDVPMDDSEPLPLITFRRAAGSVSE